ncbi:MAG: restriction endonuclease subunit S [Acidobacteria bacterium]|nr:restriction endonuclease subunit S [Acidobacteriota bacterium]
MNQHVAVCRFARPDIAPRFVLWGLRGPTGQEQLLDQRYGQGKPGLNLNNIRAIELPIPDLAEQLRIVDCLDRLEARVKALDELREKRDAELHALLPAILDRAFRREL